MMPPIGPRLTPLRRQRRKRRGEEEGEGEEGEEEEEEEEEDGTILFASLIRVIEASSR